MTLSIRAIMNYLIDEAASLSHPEALAEVFSNLVWSLNDNGAEVLQVRDEWLVGDDEKRVVVALIMEEVFPFDGGERMLAELARIGARWPSLCARIDEILASWAKTVEARR